MIPSLRRQAVVQAGVGLLACFVFLPHNVDAAPIKSVGVSVATTQGEVPDSVRIQHFCYWKPCFCREGGKYFLSERGSVQ